MMTDLAGRATGAGRGGGRVRPPAGLDADVDRVDSFAGQNQSVAGQNLVEVAPVGQHRPAAVVRVIGELLVSV